jgi:two-component system chemotaxis response regulator CheB
MMEPALPAHDIIVIGASAGGIEALIRLVGRLPIDLRASVFIVLHISPWHKSHLAAILDRAGPLPVLEATGGERIKPGRIYVPRPNLHMLVDDGQIELWRGPKENLNRPAINPLFRSAAVAYGPRVVGVVLTGIVDDGSAGLWWIKRYGGVTIVQDPETAQHSDMPRNALEYVDVDFVITLEELPDLLVRLTSGEEEPPYRRAAENQHAWKHQDIE